MAKRPASAGTIRMPARNSSEDSQALRVIDQEQSCRPTNAGQQLCEWRKRPAHRTESVGDDYWLSGCRSAKKAFQVVHVTMTETNEPCSPRRGMLGSPRGDGISAAVQKNPDTAARQPAEYVPEQMQRRWRDHSAGTALESCHFFSQPLGRFRFPKCSRLSDRESRPKRQLVSGMLESQVQR